MLFRSVFAPQPTYGAVSTDVRRLVMRLVWSNRCRVWRRRAGIGRRLTAHLRQLLDEDLSEGLLRFRMSLWRRKAFTIAMSMK